MNLSKLKLKIISFLSNIKPVYLFIIIGLVIIIEAIWAYKTLIALNSIPKPNSVPINTQSVQKKVLNIIALTVSKNEFKVGESIPVTINVASNKNTAGADLIIKYDPNLLSVVTDTVKAPVAVGTIYDDYPVNKIDEKTGLITVSGITNNLNGIIPKGVFGTIIFQAKAAGVARIFFDFSKGATNDTNIIENQTARDVLEEVSNIDIKITQ